jgi:hypothetical protein
MSCIRKWGTAANLCWPRPLSRRATDRQLFQHLTPSRTHARPHGSPQPEGGVGVSLLMDGEPRAWRTISARLKSCREGRRVSVQAPSPRRTNRRGWDSAAGGSSDCFVVFLVFGILRYFTESGPGTKYSSRLHNVEALAPSGLPSTHLTSLAVGAGNRPAQCQIKTGGQCCVELSHGEAGRVRLGSRVTAC